MSAPPAPPAPKQGWAVTPAAPPPVHAHGWKELPYALLTGVGNLTATVSQIQPVTALFSGDGALSITRLSQIVDEVAALTGSGALAAAFSQIVALEALLGSEGALRAEAHDITAGYFAYFHGEGTLSAAVEGGWSQGDGLSAWWYQVYTEVGALTGSGTLTGVLLSQLEDILVSFSGDGTLAGVSVIPEYQALAQFVGSGQLSAQAFQLFTALAQLAGSGQIGAAAVAQYLQAAGFSGGSALAVALNQMYTQAAGMGGVGTMGVTVSQIYTIPAALTGAGTLSATAIAVALMGTLTDDFTTQDNTKWAYMSGASVTAQNSAQIIPGNNANVTITSHQLLSLAGSVAEVCVSQTAEQGGGTAGQCVTQLLTIDPSGYGWSMWEYNNATLYLRHTSAAGTDDATVVFDPVNHRFWRIRESGGTIYWETSPDAVTWTTQRSQATDATINIYKMQAQLLGYWTGTGAPGVILFDNFNLPTPTKFVTAALAGAGALSASTYVPVIEVNTARTNQPVPAGCTHYRVRLRGGGGGGGKGHLQSFATNGGGGGGGGGGYCDTGSTLRPRSELGSTYSVTVGGGGAQQASGTASTFSSGSITITANGGALGATSTGSTSGAGGAGGTVTASGVTLATSETGAAGGAGGPSASNPTGVAGGNSTLAGAGGGGGAMNPTDTISRTGGNGGSSAAAAGGTSIYSGGGNPGGNAAQGGGGGGGAGAGISVGDAQTGGNGGTTGAGGGAGSGGISVGGTPSNGAPGAAGETIIEFW